MKSQNPVVLVLFLAVLSFIFIMTQNTDQATPLVSYRTFLWTQHPVSKYFEHYNDRETRRKAVCIVGNRAETLLMPKVQFHHIQALLDDDVDLYLYLQSDTPVYVSIDEADIPGDKPFLNLTRVHELFSPWLKHAVIWKDPGFQIDQIVYDDAHRSHEPFGAYYGRLMFYSWKNCHQRLIKPEEVKRGERYQVIVKTRPDILLMERPNLDEVDQEPEKIFLAGGNCTENVDGTYKMEPTNVPNDKIFFGSSRMMELAMNAYDILMASIGNYPYSQVYPEALLAYAMQRVRVEYKCAALGHRFLRGDFFEHELGWPEHMFNYPEEKRIDYIRSGIPTGFENSMNRTVNS
ncbi:hypothetical protein EDD86DRAFT_248367 [Gorgonomyces haynaldii]|nr:hypothetical protein EDD86DRAFT_248367 [Gorgonomyces haynaldii]